jgi:hypothetical protein
MMTSFPAPSHAEHTPNTEPGLTQNCRRLAVNRGTRRALILIVGAMLIFNTQLRGGTWTALAHTPPEPVNTMLLLPDGTVMAAGANTENGWYRLTPDGTGSYVNGSWSTLATMHDTRLYYSSQVLQNGKVMVAGGEYGTGGATSEIYDPQSNTWTRVSVPTGLLYTGSSGDAENSAFRDSDSILIANGTMMVAPVFPYNANQTVIYDPVANTWSGGAYYLRSQNEACWTRLPDDSILTVDKASTDSERYIPALTNWINDATLPVGLYDSFGDEIGASFLLPDGRVFFLGSTGYTAFYTPAGGTNVGTWLAGPLIPNGQGTPDAPAAMMVNGVVLCAVSPTPTATNEFATPTSFYEFDPVTNAFTRVNSPTGGLTYPNTAPYVMRMLDLPDGTVLLSISGSQLYVYQPGSAPLVAGKPTIISLTNNANGSFHLTGTLLNGISEGAAYGDDAQMDSNYPLVRLTNSANGTVYYARTFNWSRTSVMTGTNILTTEFALPAGFPLADYSLVAVANGISSDPVPFLFSTSPPVITLPPLNQTVTMNGSVTFSVAAVGTPLSYFWLRNNVIIPGATNSFYTTNNVQVSDSGTQFSCLVSNVNGTTLSSAAILTVLLGIPPAITVQPASVTVGAGSSATFSMTATSSVPFTYFWQRNGAYISGATNSFYTTNNVQQSDSGALFSCLVSNAFGTTLSSNAVLTVTPPTLVQNGGFEAGSFTNWTQSGSTANTSIINGNSSYVHSGIYGAQFGPAGTLGFISQTLTTTKGQSYLLSFWLDNPTKGTPNQFQASWNGSSVFSQSSFGVLAWTNLQFIVTATATSTLLQFGFRNDPQHFGFDDVSVTAIPPAVFQTVVRTNNTLRFSWSARAGLAYQMQYSTNLAQTGWINLGAAITATNSTVTATDTPGTDPTRFYRLLVLP